MFRYKVICSKPGERPRTALLTDFSDIAEAARDAIVRNLFPDGDVRTEVINQSQDPMFVASFNRRNDMVSEIFGDSDR